MAEAEVAQTTVEAVQRFASRPATDVFGGFQAWRAAGLPVEPGGGRPR